MTVRLEQPGDADQIRVVNQRAFDGPGEAALVDALRGSPGAVSLVAVIDGCIVGHILFTPVHVEGAEPAASGVGLAPMAVSPEFQHQGIGSQLARAGLDLCRSLGHGYAVVVGHADYYPRFGFVRASAHHLRCEFPVPDEAFMVLELQAGGLAQARGIVRYAPEFSQG